MAIERTAAWPHLSPSVCRTPIYFGPAGQALFGWYHAPPVAGPPTRAAAVICPPVGHEYTNAHRTLRHLADELACCGIGTLRFDYPGTGDSADAADAPDALAAWVASVGRAIHAVRGYARCDQVGLAGLRFGATLAALATADLDVSWLALWAPYTRGRAFLRELKALALGGEGQAPASDVIEAAGFHASAALQRAIAAIDLTTVVPRTARVLVAERDDRPPDAALEAHWRMTGVDVTRWTLPGFADMVSAPHHAIVPTSAIRTIVDWAVDADHSRGRSIRRATPVAPPRVPALKSDDVRESTLRFGHGSLFGIVAEPDRRPPAPLPAIVLSNAGSAHHTGPNRLYVELARAFARSGFVTLRFDLPGLGDSVVEHRLENIPYPDDASRTIDCALSALENLCAARTFVLMGLCSGAHAAFHAAADLAHRQITEAVLINPLTFAYRAGMPLDAPSNAHADRWRRYRHSMRSVAGWRKLLRPGTDVSVIARDVLTRTAHVVKDRLSSLAEFSAATDATRTPVAATLEQLAQRGQHVTLVCARFDPGYDLLMLEAAPLARRLIKNRQLTTWFVDGANHTFDARESRARLVASLTRHLTTRYRA